MAKIDCKTWIEIDREAALQNVRAFRSILSKKTKLWAVVKSNAYGHGLEVFSAIVAQKVDGFCVDSVVEGHKLRESDIKKPILVLGPTLPGLFKVAAADDLIITVSNFDALKSLAKSGVALNFFLKVDTGMHRQGFSLNDLAKVIKELKVKSEKLKVCLRGAYTHFAAAKDITYPDYTLRQIGEFKRAIAILNRSGFKNLKVSASATGGAMLYPQAHFDFVRIGLGLYGYFPTKETEAQHPLVLKKRLDLRPVLSWRAVISEIKKLKAGDFIGYDLTERMEKDGRTAVIPIGYWHGFPRTLSGKSEVLIKGRRAKVLGRVSMDLVVVRLPEKLQVKLGDKATLIGKDGHDKITADDVASLAGTINYELLTRINPLIKRQMN